jgi:hypothetical protein
MKVIHQHNWRVEITLNPMTLQDLGFDVEADVITAPFVIVTRPQKLKDLEEAGLTSSLVQLVREIQCDNIIATLRSSPVFAGGEVVCDETAVCSFCEKKWAEATARDIARWPEKFAAYRDPADAVGQPLCCADAIDEWQQRVASSRV